MIRTADRKGNVVEEDSFQNNLLEKIYGSASGRALLRPLVTPPVSIAVGKLLDSGISAAAVKPFIWMNHLDMGDYEEQKYTSYNEFFKRKIREGARSIDMKPKHFISPCDCRASVYPVDRKTGFSVKHTRYTVEELLKNPSLGKRFQGGYVWVLRLCVQDYHRYIYPDNARESRRVKIPGILHTVNPAANDAYPIYKENSREFSLLKTENFSTVLMMEVGALMVGKIENRPRKPYVFRGEEKGNFAFGGSTIVLITQKNTVKPDEDILKNSGEGIETRVLMGEKMGESF